MKFLKKMKPALVSTGTANVENSNPYLTARRSWNEHVGSLVTSNQTWQIIALISALLTLAAVGGITYIGAQSKFVPYVVQVDQIGKAVAVAPAQTAKMPDSRVVHAMVASFISDARTVSADVALQRRAIFRVYAMLAPNDAATQKMNSWLNSTPEQSPFKRAETGTVSVEIISVIPQTPDTWEVEWKETENDRQGVIKGQPARMRALVTVYFVPPTAATTEENIRMNPLGIFVRDFSWSKQV